MASVALNLLVFSTYLQFPLSLDLLNVSVFQGPIEEEGAVTVVIKSAYFNLLCVSEIGFVLTASILI